MVWPVIGAIAGEYLSSEFQGQHNAREASKNRAFQERMSSTAYTRAAHDLKTAGLNRVLAMGNPASTPSGSTSSVDKPNFSQAAINAASAKQAIQLQKAEESLTRQKESESNSSEALNNAMALTQSTQQSLNAANAASAIENAKLIQEQARKVKIEADRGDVMNPFYELGGELTRKLSDWLRNSGKSSNKVVDDVVKTFDDARKSWVFERPIDTIKRKFNEKGDTKVIESQKWPNFKRGRK